MAGELLSTGAMGIPPGHLIVSAFALLLAACGAVGWSPGDGEGAVADPARGAQLAIRIRASTAPFPHLDGLAGQTAIAAVGGARSLQLLRFRGDPDPVRLFDHGPRAVEVDYNDGGDTLVATVPAARLRPGIYVLARLVHSHSRYRVAATGHGGFAATPGVLDNLVVMSDRALVDGVLRDGGYYESTFTGPQGAPVRTVGDDYHVPEWSPTAGAQAFVEEGEWAVYFPVLLTVHALPDRDATLAIDVNLDHAFRWVDLPLPTYRPGAFDVTPSWYEPVIRFGGNWFTAALD